MTFFHIVLTVALCWIFSVPLLSWQMLSSSLSLLLSLSAPSACSTSTSAAVSQLCTQTGGAGVTRSHQETRQVGEMKAGEEVPRGPEVISNLQVERERVRISFGSWWRMQRQMCPCTEKARRPAEDMWRRKSCPLPNYRNLWTGLSMRAVQSPATMLRGCWETSLAALFQVPVVGQRAQCCTHLPQQFTAEEVVGQQGNENIKGSLDQRKPLNSVFSLSVKQLFIIPSKKDPDCWLGAALNWNTCVSCTHSLAIICRGTDSSVVHTRCLTSGKAGCTDPLAGETWDCVRLSLSHHWTAFLCSWTHFSPSLQPLNTTQRSWSWIPVKLQCWQRL